jgi:hypothetical protein
MRAHCKPSSKYKSDKKATVIVDNLITLFSNFQTKDAQYFHRDATRNSATQLSQYIPFK